MITFNGVEPPQQPVKVNENPATVKTDTYAIDGTPSRMQLPSRERSQMTFDMARPETFQFFKALYDAATPVTYRNDDSNVSGGVLEFSGILDYNESEFVRGGSLMVPLQVTIMQGNVNEV